MGVISCASFNTWRPVQDAATIAWCRVITALLGSSWCFPGGLHSLFTSPMAPPGREASVPILAEQERDFTPRWEEKGHAESALNISFSQNGRVCSFRLLCRHLGGERQRMSCKKSFQSGYSRRKSKWKLNSERYTQGDPQTLQWGGTKSSA